MKISKRVSFGRRNTAYLHSQRFQRLIDINLIKSYSVERHLDKASLPPLDQGDTGT